MFALRTRSGRRPGSVVAVSARCHDRGPRAHRREKRRTGDRAAQRAIGFHGTSRDAVAHLLARDFQSSDQHFEWLGTGFYFWQDSPWRARQWAEERFGVDAAVVVARIDLDSCLDLLNPRWQRELADADFDFVFQCVIEGQTIPENSDRGNHARDAATINWYCDRAAAIGRVVRSVRAVFEEGEPIFEASKIRSKSHVQIAVRDHTAILDIEEVSS